MGFLVQGLGLIPSECLVLHHSRYMVHGGEDRGENETIIAAATATAAAEEEEASRSLVGASELPFPFLPPTRRRFLDHWQKGERDREARPVSNLARDG